MLHLAELDTRDVHLREGYGSLFVYCRDALGLSEWEAYNRIEVARAARRFPVILDMLEDGSINLTAVRLLAPHLTPGNHQEVLASARGKRKPEVEEIVARLSPRPDVTLSIRRLPTPPSETAPLAMPRPANAPPAAAAPAPLPVGPDPVTPLSPDRYKLQLTIGGATLEKLRLAKDMLGHAIPTGDDAAVLDRALTALLAELARKKFAQAPPLPRDEAGGPLSFRQGQACRLAAGPRALRIHRAERSSVQRAPVRGVAPRRPLRAGWRGDRRPDRLEVPAPQRLRGAVVLRQTQVQAQRTCSGNKFD